MSLIYSQIIVAVDGSDESVWAFKKAVAVAKRNDANLNLVNIIDTRSYSAVEAYDRSIAERAQSYAVDLLEDFKAQAIEAGLTNINVIVEYGSPKTMIPREIPKKIKADLIICGATGLNPVERFLIGSVSENIVRSAKCDVLVVRTPEDIDIENHPLT